MQKTFPLSPPEASHPNLTNLGQWAFFAATTMGGAVPASLVVLWKHALSHAAGTLFVMAVKQLLLPVQ